MSAQFSYELSGLESYMCTSHAIEIPSTQHVHITAVQYDPQDGATPTLEYILQPLSGDSNGGGTSYSDTVNGTYSGTSVGIDWYDVVPGTYYLFIKSVGEGAVYGFNVNGYVTAETSGTVIANPLTTCTDVTE